MFCSKNKHLLDYKKLARTEEKVEVALTVANLLRCEGMLTEDDVIEASLSVRSEFGSYFLEVVVSANLNLNCQRCMENFSSVMTVKNHFVVVEDEFDKKIEQFPDHEPVVQADQSRVDFFALIEEEILLNIPAIPMHKEDSHCRQDVAEFAI